MSAGFERLHSALHVPLKHLPVLAVLAFRQPPGHEVTTVLPLILDTSNTSNTSNTSKDRNRKSDQSCQKRYPLKNTPEG